MRLTNYKVNFSGIQQNHETQKYINEIVMSLTHRVPSESSFVLNISENQKKVLGDFTVKSSVIKFESVKKADTAINVMNLIFEDMVQQIEFWIAKRVV